MGEASVAQSDKFKWSAQKKFWDKEQGKRKMRAATIAVNAAKEKHAAAVKEFGAGSTHELSAKALVDQAEAAKAETATAYHAEDPDMEGGKTADGVTVKKAADGSLKLKLSPNKVKSLESNGANAVDAAAAGAAKKQTDPKALEALENVKKTAKAEIAAAKKEAKKEVKAAKKEAKKEVKKEEKKVKKVKKAAKKRGQEGGGKGKTRCSKG